MCWGFLTSYQKKKHLEHTHYTINPSFFKNEEMFIRHAKSRDKLKDNDTMVAIFNESCKMGILNPYITHPPV